MAKKVVIITCYKDPDYIRSRTLRSALRAIAGTRLLVVKNSHLNVLRYIEVVFRVLWVRIKHRPDLYILTFRGYEILPFIRLVSLGKPLYFDEFINLEEWLVYEHQKLREGSLAHRSLHQLYRYMLLSVQKILTDTPQHADYSSRLMRLPRQAFLPVPVGTDEETFKPTDYSPEKTAPLRVFYYGSMLPLHGLDKVCEAALILKDESVLFTLIGGDELTEAGIKDYVGRGARITHRRRVPFEELPKYISESDVCLGGPFGDTVQASMVITGKTYQFLASGRATVVGKIKGATQFRDKENCLLVELGDAKGLAEAIKWARHNPSKLQAIARNGRKLFEENYSTAQIAKILGEVI